MKSQLKNKKGIALIITVLVVGVFVTFAGKTGCACTPSYIVEEEERNRPKFTREEAHALLGRVVTVKDDFRMGVFNPYASVSVPVNAVGRVLTIKEHLDGDDDGNFIFKGEYEVVVGFGVRPDRVDTNDFTKDQFVETLVVPPDEGHVGQ